MFGQFFQSRDSELTAAVAMNVPAAAQCELQLSYARDLIVELLNRAAMLEEGAYWFAFTQHAERGAGDPEYHEALENLAGAVRLFLDDCSEARLRAKRARLVNTDSQTKALVETGSVESEEDLAAIGGALVPESWS